MSKVYITGHRNPDLDSLCAALSYAKLKNMTDMENEYVPVHCSPVSDGVRKQMEAMGLEIPVYKKDVRPKVKDVVMVPATRFQTSQPIFDLVQTYNTENPPVIPLFEGEAFKGLLSVDDITEDTVSERLTTNFMPDPELLIRTGGELRISNYLLWQIAYSELYFCDTYWPDFSEEDLRKAIASYQHRQRRFGKTETQVENEGKA